MTDALILYIQQNAQWAAAIVFIVALLESLAIVGLLIPGWLILVGVGSLIGAEALAFYPIAIAAYFGAVIGEYFSYWLGFHYHEKLLSWRFFARHEKLIETSRQFFHRHGVSGVFLGRFFGPTRAVVPFIAGVTEMKQATFFWVNLISGLFWAPLYLIPGILLGAAFSLDSSTGNSLMGILLIIAVTAIMAWNYGKLALVEWLNSGINLLRLIKAILAIIIFILSVILFVKSIYWPVFGDILQVLADKLV